jgi:hypothetical protein
MMIRLHFTMVFLISYSAVDDWANTPTVSCSCFICGHSVLFLKSRLYLYFVYVLLPLHVIHCVSFLSGDAISCTHTLFAVSSLLIIPTFFLLQAGVFLLVLSSLPWKQNNVGQTSYE